jgi:deoxyribodipyrimidine photo-lyase
MTCAAHDTAHTGWHTAGVVSVMWFRRDLRVADNPALAAAAAQGSVLGLFVVDPVLDDPAGRPRQRFLRESVAALGAATGGRLLVRAGDPVSVVPEVARAVGAGVVFCTKDFGNYGRRRDAAVGAALRADGRRLRGIGSPYVVEPGALRKADGTGYAVFSAYWRAWQQVPVSRVTEPVDVEWIDGRGATREPDDVAFPAARPTDAPTPTGDAYEEWPAAGEPAARTRWRWFLEHALADYATQRDMPSADGSSRMSPYLRWGVVHPLTLLADLDDSPGAQAYRRELCWRDFYADVLHRHPRSAWQNLDARYDAMAVDRDRRAEERFAAWCAGRTGYPLVDAGMHQLAATAWMHNRVRMVTASFLVKDLHLPWQWGARFFMHHLVDGDLASNNHGWQWVAGSGTDAAPYHRVLNPDRQAERFDPAGAYVRRWLGATPLAPRLVDHAIEREEALRRRRSLA